MWVTGEDCKVILFYRYVEIDDVQGLIQTLQEQCKELGLLGRILIAKEGINGTLAGSREDIDSFITFMTNDERFRLIDWKSSIIQSAECLPFLCLSIREVSEIISCGNMRPFIDQTVHFNANSFGGLDGTGKHLTPVEFHEILTKTRPSQSISNEEETGKSRPEGDDYVLLDIRNEFEYNIGHFQHAKNIGTVVYSETFQKLNELLGNKPLPEEDSAPLPLTSTVMKEVEEEDESVAMKDKKQGDGLKEKKILMYCTGGIRCEKASAYLKAIGFEQVYQLQGGIHRYLEVFPDGGAFEGKNFVFDSRVSVPPASLSAPESSLSTVLERTVVGACIECTNRYDEYSGDRVCTVCRQPLLICPHCVNDNPFPSEYYCTRHRELKGIYFTLLHRFTNEQLQQQIKQLQQLLSNCLEIAEKRQKVDQRGKTQKKRKLSVDKRLDQTQQSDERCLKGDVNRDQAVGEVIDDANSELLKIPQYEYGRNRRKSLRKQIQKIESFLIEREKMLTLSSSLDYASKEETSPIEDPAASTAEESFLSPSSIPSSSVTNIPKQSRLGNGFWRN